MDKPHRKRKISVFFSILIACVAAFIISKYFYQLAMITGDSMNPTYKNFRFVLIDKRSAAFERGDVIGFHAEEVNGLLVKRIVAIPGDRILIKGGKLTVNGNASNDVPPEAHIKYAGTASTEILLGKGEYFLMGDNFEKSKDSRYALIGIVKEEQIVGKILPNKVYD